MSSWKRIIPHAWTWIWMLSISNYICPTAMSQLNVSILLQGSFSHSFFDRRVTLIQNICIPIAPNHTKPASCKKYHSSSYFLILQQETLGWCQILSLCKMKLYSIKFWILTAFSSFPFWSLRRMVPISQRAGCLLCLQSMDVLEVIGSSVCVSANICPGSGSYHDASSLQRNLVPLSQCPICERSCCITI